MHEFDNIFPDATAAIGKQYMHLAIAGQELPIYRERVYCYELYHQLRCRWPTHSSYSLGGEVDKKGHPLIRGNDLDNRKPDLLIHEPGDMGGNFAIIEVKPANADASGVAKDLRTLIAFLRLGEYRRGLLLVYGDDAGLPWFAERVQTKQQEHADLALELWWHRAPGEAAFRVL